MKEEEIRELEARLKKREEKFERLKRVRALCEAGLIERPKKKGIFSLARYCPRPDCGKKLKSVEITPWVFHYLYCDCGYEWVETLVYFP